MITRCIWTVALAGLASVVAAQDVVPSERVRNSVTVFEEASSSSSRVGRLRVGQRATLIENVPRWREVELGNGQRGFVSKSWTRVVEGGLAPRAQDELRIRFLNIGAGTCTVVECPGPDAPPMIVDCGSVGPTDAGMDEEDARQYIQGVLASHSLAPNVVLSHAHEDHYGWIAEVLADTRVQSVWQGGNPDRYTRGDFPDWLVDQRDRGASVHNEFPEDWHNDGNALDELSCGAASVFALTVNSGNTANANSLILSLEHGEFVATFTGDAEGSTERAARENFDGNVKATVLSSSHHGARTHASNSQRWVDATDPEVAIFSAGRRFGHPQCDAVNRFQGVLAGARRHPARCGEGPDYEPVFNTNLAQYMTEINGLIVVTSDGESPLSLFCDGSTGCETEIAH